MKKLILSSVLATLSLVLLDGAPVESQKPSEPASKSPSSETPPVFRAATPPPPPDASAANIYDQKPIAPRPPLVTPQQAQAIIDKFKAAYSKMGSPRLLVYVNRQLVDENSGLKLIARTEKIDTTRMKTDGTATGDAGKKSGTTTEKTARENRYRMHERSEPALADRQTVRDVERLFGRPLRQAGASLADQQVATQLIADKPHSLTAADDQARKDREALSKLADVAIEILISSRTVTVTEISGESTYTVPDIQATAIRLKDARIMGQASATDIQGKDPRHDVSEITEATALALMEDMLTSAEGAGATSKP